MSKLLQFALVMMAVGGLLVHLAKGDSNASAAASITPTPRHTPVPTSTSARRATAAETLPAPPASPSKSARPRAIIAAQIAPDASASGLMVSGVAPGGPADAAGIRRGDVLVAVDGVATRSVEAFQALTDHSGPGATVKIDATRDGEPLTFAVTLKALEDPKTRP